jgi:decaprenylphospho-beta-D-ribofuranose 2-oxidase
VSAPHGAPRREALLTGWGRTAPSRATIVEVTGIDDVVDAWSERPPRGVLARGLGRSYGDVAQNGGGVVLDMTALSGIEELDEDAATLTALAGTSLASILQAIVPRGWFPPVAPGTRLVTLGGAIANDVHGKNHHREGSIGHHLLAFDLLGADGEVRSVTPDSPPGVFDATVGGLGLTGIVLRATIGLMPIETSRVRVDTERAADLDELMTKMEAGDDGYRYSVAWIDALARGRRLGRSVLTRGDHAALGELDQRGRRDPLSYRPRSLPSVPPLVPGVITPLTARAFNELWFRKAPRDERDRIEEIAPFFHPLDAVGSWNRLYGRHGFVQYQCLVPYGAEATVRTVLERLAAAQCASFLAVLKRFGPGRGMLSFPAPGWTLALDLPAAQGGLGELLDGLDRLVVGAGGRVYLAKDARMDASLLAPMYPELERWREVRDSLDPGGVFRSDMDRRLGLAPAAALSSGIGAGQ